MTPPRPARYRVVERGRRLEVIDTWKGHAPPPPATSAAPAPRSAGSDTIRAMAALQRPGHRGQRIVTTSAWYDAKGPRPIAIGHEGEMRLRGLRFLAGVGAVVLLVLAVFFWPFFAVVGFLLVYHNGSARRRIAAWLDRIDQPVTTASESSG